MCFVDFLFFLFSRVGCFFVVVIMKENAGSETQGKLLFEGVATLLKNIMKTDHSPLIVQYAALGKSIHLHSIFFRSSIFLCPG
jgi:hypothetical protein